MYSLQVCTAPYTRLGHPLTRSDSASWVLLLALCLQDPCNAACACSDFDSYLPVCGSNGLSYFSPCFAGCSDEATGGEYSGCSCISLYGGQVRRACFSGMMTARDRNAPAVHSTAVVAFVYCIVSLFVCLFIASQHWQNQLRLQQTVCVSSKLPSPSLSRAGASSIGWWL